MVKLFLVEDEAIIRDGIKKHIDWEAEGIEFVGEAGDGEMALPLILETRPDNLVTDIKMPFMDGLKLAARVKKNCRRPLSLSFLDIMTFPMPRRRFRWE